MASPQADSLTEEQVSEFKEAFSLFVSSPHTLLLDFWLLPISRAVLTPWTGQGRRWLVPCMPYFRTFANVPTPPGARLALRARRRGLHLTAT